jgi:hypothetical protein
LGVATRSAALVAASLWVAFAAPLILRVLGWFGVAFFGLGLVVGMIRAVRPPRVLALTGRALVVKAGLRRRGPVEWSAIVATELRTWPAPRVMLGPRPRRTILHIALRDGRSFDVSDAWIDDLHSCAMAISERASVPLRDVRTPER